MQVTVTTTPNRPDYDGVKICEVKTTGFYKAKFGSGLWYIDAFKGLFLSIGENFNISPILEIHDRTVVPVEGMDINIKIST